MQEKSAKNILVADSFSGSFYLWLKLVSERTFASKVAG
jgi:hypothetical protein